MDKNCERCNKRSVCFIQPQINSLATKAIDRPFFRRPKFSGDRTQKELDWNNDWSMRQDKVNRELCGVIAEYCQLYQEK